MELCTLIGSVQMGVGRKNENASNFKDKRNVIANITEMETNPQRMTGQ